MKKLQACTYREKTMWTHEETPGLHMQRKDYVRIHEETPGLYMQRKAHMRTHSEADRGQRPAP